MEIVSYQFLGTVALVQHQAVSDYTYDLVLICGKK